MSKQGKEQIYSEIKKRITNLEYKPGELLNEKDLAEEFGVSRTPVREALLKLSEKKLVVFVPRVGIYVSQIDLKAVKEAYIVRKSLEALAAELAALKATDEEAQELVGIVKKIEKHDAQNDYEQCLMDDQLFHRRTWEIADNDILLESLEDLNNVTTRFLHHIHYVVDNPGWYYDSLNHIAYAIKNKDTKRASETAYTHIAVFVEKLFRTFLS